jgi:hypothetical protein
MFVIRIIEDVRGVWPQVAGTYFERYDPEACRGAGRLFVSAQIERACCFATIDAAVAVWARYPQLQELTMAIVPADASAGQLKDLEAIAREFKRPAVLQ